MQKPDGECPVCGGPTARTIDSDEGRVYEEDEVCREGCYDFHFSHGHFWVRVGRSEWNWDWKEESPKTEMRLAIAAIKTNREGMRGCFMAAIRAEPRELTHRRAFADWLDDNDEPELADFYRRWTVERYDFAVKWLRAFAEIGRAHV